MMSISPEFGHPTTGKFAPSIQKAGHAAIPTGDLIRASTFPYLKVNFFSVFILAEVTVPSRTPHGAVGQSAVMTRLPLSTFTLSGEDVYSCHSLLPQPLSP